MPTDAELPATPFVDTSGYQPVASTKSEALKPVVRIKRLGRILNSRLLKYVFLTDFVNYSSNAVTVADHSPKFRLPATDLGEIKVTLWRVVYEGPSQKDRAIEHKSVADYTRLSEKCLKGLALSAAVKYGSLERKEKSS
jgi:hypothetical protein